MANYPLQIWFYEIESLLVIFSSQEKLLLFSHSKSDFLQTPNIQNVTESSQRHRLSNFRCNKYSRGSKYFLNWIQKDDKKKIQQWYGWSCEDNLPAVFQANIPDITESSHQVHAQNVNWRIQTKIWKNLTTSGGNFSWMQNLLSRCLPRLWWYCKTSED